ncbi:hypothetical protein J3D47_002721 [Pseudomonas laurylsulfativorans]|uniref:hypothetical protein n=1 Tax=Pseudomonas laurylsulfativorans TaxID=1943631 RepID=UPI0020A00F11|nr:hypothetical protein [Pseudomonas laurylsulfativorans]MCP1418478.1 hypothetical protein [Pseudomonas laurylsulfativorans]
MSVREFATQLLSSIKDIKANSESIQCDNLITYLEQVIATAPGEPGPDQIEQLKAKLQIMVETEKSHHASDLEMFRTVIQSGQNAVKTALLMNGGASVALLAFIGKLTEVQQARIPVFAEPLTFFVLGVLAIVITAGSTYLSQWFYAASESWKQRTGMAFNILSILLGLCSYGFFVWGMRKAYVGFLTFA